MLPKRAVAPYVRRRSHFTDSDVVAVAGVVVHPLVHDMLSIHGQRESE